MFKKFLCLFLIQTTSVFALESFTPEKFKAMSVEGKQAIVEQVKQEVSALRETLLKARVEVWKGRAIYYPTVTLNAFPALGGLGLWGMVAYAMIKEHGKEISELQNLMKRIQAIDALPEEQRFKELVLFRLDAYESASAGIRNDISHLLSGDKHKEKDSVSKVVKSFEKRIKFSRKDRFHQHYLWTGLTGAALVGLSTLGYYYFIKPQSEQIELSKQERDKLLEALDGLEPQLDFMQKNLKALEVLSAAYDEVRAN